MSYNGYFDYSSMVHLVDIRDGPMGHAFGQFILYVPNEFDIRTRYNCAFLRLMIISAKEGVEIFKCELYFVK